MANDIRLRDINTSIIFSIEFDPNTDEIVVNYKDESIPEKFYGFKDFLNSLSDYYKNIIDGAIEKEQKINFCNQFLDTIEGYKMQFRDFVKNEADFFKEIALFKEHFCYYKQRFHETDYLKISSNNSATLYGTKEQILILEYTGLLDYIFVDLTKQNIQNRTAIISALINKNKDNVRKTINNIKGTPKEAGKDITKTRANLTSVKSFFDELGLKEISDKIQSDIDRIKKK